MNKLMIEAKIDDEGRVKIPDGIREAADLYCGESVTFSYNEEEDTLTLKLVMKLCKLCDNEKGEIEIKENILICKKCEDLLKDKLKCNEA